MDPAPAVRHVRRALRPLAEARTYRRGVFLLLGAVVLLPYVLLGAVFVQMFTGDVPRIPVVVLLGLTLLIATAPAILRPTRALEIHAVRGLLDLDLPDPPPASGAVHGNAVWRVSGWETRVATATWYALHLLAGGVVAAVLFVVMPIAVVYVLVRLGLDDESLVSSSDLGALAGVPAGWLTLLAVLAMVATVYLVAGLGALLARLAPALLGPSAAERVVMLEAAAATLAERNRLARELHDSVGHALTVTTLQAAAARTVLDRDPAFARRALAAIEEAGRAAMADLDHVIGLLREADDAGPAATAPQPTLAHLDRLLADVRATGLAVDTSVTGAFGRVPAAVSREGYRIVQEGLTNALRHGDGRTQVRIAAGEDALHIEVRNAVRSNPGPSSGVNGARAGSGLAGMRERVRLLDGTLQAGPARDGWLVTSTLPYATGRGDAPPPPHDVDRAVARTPPHVTDRGDPTPHVAERAYASDPHAPKLT